MKADAMSLSFLGNESIVRIPFFQRSYVWNYSNWDDILSDLLEFGKSQYLGSVILKQLPQQSGRPKEVMVIDGQQRLTTLSLLIRALYNSFDSQLQQNCLLSFNSLLFYKKNQTDDEQFVKIEHSKFDKLYFRKIIENSFEPGEYEEIEFDLENPHSKSTSNKVLQCFKFFTERLKLETLESRKTLFNRLVEQHNKILVVIDLSEKEDEQKIFDTINSAGVRLSSSDIIKNAMFQRALDLYDDHGEVEKLYNETWQAAFLADEEAIKFWETPRPTGRHSRDNIEILLHSIAVIKGFFDVDKNTLSDLAIEYKSYINGCDKKALNTFVQEIGKYAKLYREKILVFEGTDMHSYSNAHARLFHILNICEITTFHPYILHLFYTYSSNNIKLDSELKKIETLVIRRAIAKADTKSYSKFCRDFIKSSVTIDAKINEVSDEQIQNGLFSITNKNAALVLFWVELYRRDIDTKQSIKDLKYSYTLEHVMPHKWEQYWSNVEILDKDGNKFSDPALAAKERIESISSIGNMTLLNSSLNISLRNHEFSKKITGEGRKRGIKDYGELYITKFDIVDPFEKGDTIWNEKKIRERNQRIVNDILNIWPATPN